MGGVMQDRKRGTLRDLRRETRSALLWPLYLGSYRSRLELSEMTGLSPASVSNVVRELLDEGILVEAGSVDSDGGRPRVLLQMNPEYGYVIGVDIGETRVEVELFDLAMKARAKTGYRLDSGEREAGIVAGRVLAGLGGGRAGGVSGCRESWRRGRKSWCTARPMAGTRCRSSGCCGSAPICRCDLRTARRPWGRLSCGSARAAVPGTPSWR